MSVLPTVPGPVLITDMIRCVGKVAIVTLTIPVTFIPLIAGTESGLKRRVTPLEHLRGKEVVCSSSLGFLLLIAQVPV